MKDEVAVARALKRIAQCAVTPGHIWVHTETKTWYEIVCLSIDEESLAVLVTYRSLMLDRTWTRKLDVFLGPNDHGQQRFEPLDPGEEHYASGAKRCCVCGSADVQPFGMGCEIFRYGCRTCGADPA